MRRINDIAEIDFFTTCLTPPFKIITRLHALSEQLDLYRKVEHILGSKSVLSGQFVENLGFRRKRRLDD